MSWDSAQPSFLTGNYRLVLPVRGQNGLVLEPMLLADCADPLVFSETRDRCELSGEQ